MSIIGPLCEKTTILLSKSHKCVCVCVCVCVQRLPSNLTEWNECFNFGAVRSQEEKLTSWTCKSPQLKNFFLYIREQTEHSFNPIKTLWSPVWSLGFNTISLTTWPSLLLHTMIFLSEVKRITCYFHFTWGYINFVITQFFFHK